MKTLIEPRAVTANAEQRLFVIPCGDSGYSCLGFDVCFERHSRLAAELGLPLPTSRGSLADYRLYELAVEAAREKHARTGWCSQSELVPQFIGREGARVEIVTEWGETRRFTIGKSTGFIPCHLAVSRKGQRFCDAIYGPFKSIRFL